MGRDPSPWIHWQPQLAFAEIVARCSPFFAFLARTSITGNTRTGFAVEPNSVFLQATERSAQAAFGYRLGMTMADWVCRALMGLGPTTHAEAVVLAGAGPAWNDATGLPDLTGVHPHDGRSWLIEAKGGRKVGLGALRKGAHQVCKDDLMSAPHTRILCGASMEHRLIVTVDLEDWTPSLPVGRSLSIEEDDQYLIDTTRSRMLIYYALAALPSGARAALPVGPAFARQSRRTGLLTSLVNDPATAQARSRSQRSPTDPDEMLVGQVPNTSLYIGMSRRQFGACRAVAQAQSQFLRQNDWMASQQTRTTFLDRSESEINQQLRSRDMMYLNSTRDWPELETQARRGFITAERTSWQDLLQTPVREIRSLPNQVVESATEDTYLAIDRSALS
jgi:hypothetical protein